MHNASRALIRRLIFAAIVIGMVPLPATWAENPAPGHVKKSARPKYAEGEVLVKFRPNKSPAAKQKSHATFGAKTKKQFRVDRDLELVTLPAGMKVKEALRHYRLDPNVAYAEPNYRWSIAEQPNDPLFPSLWGLHNTGQTGGVADADIDAPEAWGITTGSPDVVIGVIDTGVDYNHPDLAGNIWSNTADCNHNGVDDDGDGYADDCHGIDTANGDRDPMDDNSHGTHVSGTIGATGNNGVGVVGVNWTVRIAACKFLDSEGGGWTSDAVECLDYFGTLKDRGVNIVATSNSWGGGGYSQALYDAIHRQMERGILFVAAAGNSASDNDYGGFYPAGYGLPNIIAVAATDSSDSLADFSSYGRHTVELGAPGVGILSTVPNNSYDTYSGTSMATPHVTGVIGLLKAQDPNRDWRALRNLIITSGDPIPALAQTISGRRLNAYNGLTCSDRWLQSRLEPRAQSGVVVGVGQTVPLSFVSVHCDQAAGPVSVAITETGEVQTLHDDGVAPDQWADDGIFSGQFTAGPVGSYTLNFPGGDSVVVTSARIYSPHATDYVYRQIAGTNLNLGDDDFAQITLPFPIQFGGASLDHLFVGSNGLISFNAGIWDYFNVSLPAPYEDAIVAPFWDDLYPFPDTAGNVFYDVIGTAPNRELVVEWRQVSSWDAQMWCNGDERIRFQVVFSEATSDVLFNYADVIFNASSCYGNHGDSATVGIQLGAGQGSQFSYDSPSLSNGMALLWSMGGGDNPVPSISSLSPASRPANAGDFSLAVHGADFTFGSQVLWNGSPKPTVFDNGTLLRAAISNADAATPGPVSVSVRNPAPGGGDSAPLTFTVGPPATITVTAPNGGEIWDATSQHVISWTYSVGLEGGTVRLELLKGGSPVSTIAVGVSIGANGSGSFAWMIPGATEGGSDYRIRVSSETFAGVQDGSDADFTIRSAVTLLSPNGGETWTAGSTQTISWTYLGNPGPQMIIELIRPGGSTVLAQGIPIGNNGAGSYTWTVSGVPSGSDYRVRVFAGYDPGGGDNAGDFSDGPFTIVGDTSITVTAPNGGEIWTNGSPQTVTWTYTGSPGPLAINLLQNGVAVAHSLVLVSPGNNGSGSAQWDVWPQVPGDNYRILVAVNGNSLVQDQSDADFSIHPAPPTTLTVTSPNGFEVWDAGTTHTISWSYTGDPGPTVTVNLVWNLYQQYEIATVPIGSQGAGSLSWTIPADQPSATHYRIRLVAGLGSYVDVSDADFTIHGAPSTITLVSPNGGEVWTPGWHLISWTYSGGTFPVMIDLLKNGSIHSAIVEGYQVGTNGTGGYGWVIPADLAPGTDYQIRIWNEMDMSVHDTSDANFTIGGTHQLTVSRAGGGTGTVTSSPAGIDCGAACSASFLAGQVVTLTATAAGGSVFSGWSGACSGSGACSVTMDADKDVTASFNAQPPFGFGQPPASQTVGAGQSAQFTIQLAGQPGFAGAVALSCTSGMPQGAACSFNPASVNPGGGTAASVLTVTTQPRTTAMSRVFSSPLFGYWLAPLALLLAPLAGRTRRWRGLIVAGIMLFVIGTLAACGGGGTASTVTPHFSGTPAGTYKIGVTATSGAASQTQIVTLVVN